MTWHLADHPQAVRLLTDPDLRRFLGAFVGEGTTVTQAAQAQGWSMDAALYRVRQARDAGLMDEVGARPRRGRAQRVYRLRSPLFVPGDRLPGGPATLLHADEDAFAGQVRAARTALLSPERFGLLVTADAGGLVAEISARPSDQPAPPVSTHQDLQAPQSPAVIDISTPLKLTFEEAKALQAQLWALYQAQSERTGSQGNYLLRLTLYPSPG